MGAKDLHAKAFDETTITKLEIFEDYAEAWIPTFVMGGYSEIHVFDFFAGTGYDVNNVAGSPIRLLSKIKMHVGNIFQKKTKVHVYLNEFKSNKYQLLVNSCEEYLKDNPDLNRAITLHYRNLDFDVCFSEWIQIIKIKPSLVYLDQNGVKYLADKYLLELEKAKTADFLYFVSSSYLARFADSQEFSQHIQIDKERFKKDPYRAIHRSLLEQLKEKLPSNTKLKLYPFSLKKGTNIYGIIFGAKHVRAIEKFIEMSWKKNELNGQANFDIEEDEQKAQMHIFEGKKLNKIESFNQNLQEYIRESKAVTNAQIYTFTLEEAHSLKHANACIKNLKKSKIVTYEGRSIKLTYKDAIKNKVLVKVIYL